MKRLLFGLFALLLFVVPAQADWAAKYWITPPALVDGQGVYPLVNTSSTLYNEAGPYSTSRKTADGQVKGSAGFIHTVTVSPTTATPTAGLLTVYDSLTEANTVLYTEWIFATGIGHTIILDIPTGTGIFVGYDATLANASVQVSYR